MKKKRLLLLIPVAMWLAAYPIGVWEMHHVDFKGWTGAWWSITNFLGLVSTFIAGFIVTLVNVPDIDV